MSHDRTPILAGNNLSVHFGSNGQNNGHRHWVLRNVTINLWRGEIVGLVGESGCGKTTLGRVLLRLLAPSNGQIILDGKDVTGMSRRQFHSYRSRIQMIFQNPYAALNPAMTVNEILNEAVLIANKNLSNSERSDQVEKLIDQVSLGNNKLKSYPRTLSGGERRRVGIARILALDPDIIVADEPLASLDSSIKESILQILLSSNYHKERTYLWISHDLRLARKYCNRILVMYNGSILEEMPVRYPELPQPLHPYTKSLFEAADVLLGKSPIKAVEYAETCDDVPVSFGEGCPFADRCELRKVLSLSSLCTEDAPALIRTSEGHSVACHYLSHILATGGGQSSCN